MPSVSCLYCYPCAGTCALQAMGPFQEAFIPLSLFFFLTVEKQENTGDYLTKNSITSESDNRETKCKRRKAHVACNG